MKIAIVGTGAMGSIYAALLADAGNEVWAIDLWPEHLQAIGSHGLRVEGASGDRTVRGIHATRDVSEAADCDLFVIATKADGVASAARAVSAAMRADALVLTIQNGLGAGERIAEHMPVDHVLLGVAEGFGASMKGPGHAHHNAMKLIRIGEMGGGLSDRLQRIVEVWRHAGFEVRGFADIEQLIWEKFVCNVAFSAPCTVFECTIGTLMATPERWQVALGAAAEAYAIGCAKGVSFGFDDALDYVTEFGRRMPDARPSMLLDHLARRPSEIAAINGMVPLLGRQLGVATPYNDTLTAVIRAREAAFAGNSSGPSGGLKAERREPRTVA